LIPKQAQRSRQDSCCGALSQSGRSGHMAFSEVYSTNVPEHLPWGRTGILRVGMRPAHGGWRPTTLSGALPGIGSPRPPSHPGPVLGHAGAASRVDFEGDGPPPTFSRRFLRNMAYLPFVRPKGASVAGSTRRWITPVAYGETAMASSTRLCGARRVSCRRKVLR
jgi:hypothetical protein